eukprot:10993090-Alexandrium_andersonii.AAC.1
MGASVRACRLMLTKRCRQGGQPRGMRATIATSTFTRSQVEPRGPPPGQTHELRSTRRRSHPPSTTSRPRTMAR